MSVAGVTAEQRKKERERKRERKREKRFSERIVRGKRENMETELEGD